MRSCRKNPAGRPGLARRRTGGSLRPAIALGLALVALAGCRAAPSGPPPPGDAASLPAVLENDSLGVHDRCTSCHTGLLDASHRLDAEPLTAHPGHLLDIHPPRRFGCTPCHGGVGEATAAREAHAPGIDGVRFAGDATEIACGKCHVNEVTLDGAPHLSHGRELVRRAQCDGCHQIGESARSGRPGPDLSGIAARTNPIWLFRWIKNPRDYASNARMPRFEIEDRYVDALVGYLLTFRTEAPFDTTAFPAGDPTRGGNLVRLSFCISCHSIDEKGGTGAIDLGRVGNKLPRARLLRILAATHEADPGTLMPQYRFTNAQVADVAAYLSEQFSDPSFSSADADAALPRLGTYWPTEAERIEVGRRVFKELRCGNCHAFPGGEQWIRIGPILSNLEDKKDAEIPWGRTTFVRTLADYVWHKVQTPEVYATVPHQLKMPTYDFTPEEARDVTIALLAQADAEVLPDAFVVRSRSDESLAPPGEFGRLVQRYRCTSCHSVNGVGRNISYDLGLEGSRARREWLVRYLKLPYTIRPILTVRMPVFNLTDEEARVLADGIAADWRDPRIDALGDFASGPREVEAGRRLFEAGGCMSCHQVGSKGGYVGPSFTSGATVGEQFRRGWLVQWLQNGHDIKPDVLEPRYGFSRDEAQALTAYLMTITPDAPGSPR
jgi:mono/diheme cytochrome c family protein